MIDVLKKFRLYGLKKSLEYSLLEIFNRLWVQTFFNSYSQRREDLIIDKLLNNKKQGFYVDVGAHDPFRFSNTKRFYDKGWRGINIDPNPSSIKKFITKRKRDMNLALGIGNKSGPLSFYEFFPTTLSTFSQKEAKQYIKKGFKLVAESKVTVRTLGAVLNEFCKNRQIDFLSVDTEGTDLEVLQSNNWKNFKPKVICVETKGSFNKINTFFRKHGYQLEHNNGINSIFSVSLT